MKLENYILNSNITLNELMRFGMIDGGGKYSIESGNRFDEDSWLNRTKSFDNIDKASKYVLDLIEGRK